MPHNENPLVSIITPSYNQGKFIKRTIDSVLRQKETYPNIEYIVMDGGSTDNTVNVLKSYEGKIKWISQKDSGQTNAINKGFKMAKGEIVAWLNSDDTYEPRAVAQVVKFFKDHPNAKFVHGEGHHVDVNDQFIEKYPSEKCSLKRFRDACPICQPTAFWRKEIIDEIGYLDERWNYGMDYDYWIRTLKKYELHFLPIHLGNTRVYKDTKTFNDPEKPHLEYIKIIDSHYNTVSLSRIYGYSRARLHRHLRNTKWREFIFHVKAVLFFFPLFIKFNKKVPKIGIKLIREWIRRKLADRGK